MSRAALDRSAIAREPLLMKASAYQPGPRSAMLATYLPICSARHAPQVTGTKRGSSIHNAMASSLSSLSYKDLSSASVMIVQVRQLWMSNRVSYGCPCNFAESIAIFSGMYRNIVG